MNDLSIIENTVVKHLEPLLSGIKIKPYFGEFELESANKVSFNAPSLFISFLGAKLEPSAVSELSAETRWAGFLVLHQPRRRAKIEQQLLTNVIASLNNSSLGLKALPIVLQSFEQILSRQLERGNLTAWVIRWQQDLKLLPVSKKWDA